MSSSTSAPGPHRTRSLRQPTAGLLPGRGLGRAPKTPDDDDATNQQQPDAGLTPQKRPTGAPSVAAPARRLSPSRLPQPGGGGPCAPRAAAAGGGVGGGGTRGSSSSSSRPSSGMFGLRRANTAAARQPPAQTLAREGAAAPRTARTVPTTATTKTTGTRLARPKSMMGPSPPPPPQTASASTGPLAASAVTAGTPPPPPRPAGSHARAKSTATSLGPTTKTTTMTTMMLTTTTTTAQPPRPSSAASAASASTVGTAAPAAGTRPLARASTVTTRAAPKRHVSNTSSAANTSVRSTAATTTTATARPSRQPATDDDDNENENDNHHHHPPPPPRLRPAFTTLQQHYSPARSLAPKPSTASYLAPPTPSKRPAHVALATATAKRQTELLQLHLLHRDADAAAAAWHASARAALGRRFAALARADAHAAQQEAAVAEARNLAALLAWAAVGPGGDGGGGGGGGARGLEDKIQTLDGVLSGLWRLTEPGGRYARVVRAFDKWAGQMTAAVAARREAGGRGALVGRGDVVFVAELDPAWKDEVASLGRKVDGWRRQLGRLEEGLPVLADADDDDDKDQQPRPSLVRILAGCRSQVYDMLAELDVMEQIEREALLQEAEWIRRVNREDAADDTPGAGAIWRAF